MHVHIDGLLQFTPFKSNAPCFVLTPSRNAPGTRYHPPVLRFSEVAGCIKWQLQAKTVSSDLPFSPYPPTPSHVDSRRRPSPSDSFQNTLAPTAQTLHCLEHQVFHAPASRSLFKKFAHFYCSTGIRRAAGALVNVMSCYYLQKWYSLLASCDIVPLVLRATRVAGFPESVVYTRKP